MYIYLLLSMSALLSQTGRKAHRSHGLGEIVQRIRVKQLRHRIKLTSDYSVNPCGLTCVKVGSQAKVMPNEYSHDFSHQSRSRAEHCCQLPLLYVLAPTATQTPTIHCAEL